MHTHVHTHTHTHAQTRTHTHTLTHTLSLSLSLPPAPPPLSPIGKPTQKPLPGMSEHHPSCDESRTQQQKDQTADLRRTRHAGHSADGDLAVTHQQSLPNRQEGVEETVDSGDAENGNDDVDCYRQGSESVQSDFCPGALAVCL